MRVAADGRLLRELVVFAGCGLFVSRAGPKPHTHPNTLNLHQIIKIHLLLLVAFVSAFCFPSLDQFGTSSRNLDRWAQSPHNRLIWPHFR